MAKTRNNRIRKNKTSKNRSSKNKKYINQITKTSKKLLPIVDKTLSKVGTVAKDLTQKSIPIVEKGASIVYNTMATGFDLGVKGVKNVTNVVNKTTQKKRKSNKQQRKK